MSHTERKKGICFTLVNSQSPSLVHPEWIRIKTNIHKYIRYPILSPFGEKEVQLIRINLENVLFNVLWETNIINVVFYHIILYFCGFKNVSNDYFYKNRDLKILLRIMKL